MVDGVTGAPGAHVALRVGAAIEPGQGHVTSSTPRVDDLAPAPGSTKTTLVETLTAPVSETLRSLILVLH